MPWDKFVKKKHLKVCEIFENYVDDLADFLELYQRFLLMFLCLRYIIWWSRYATQIWKKPLVRYHLYRVFFVKKALTDDIN